MESLASLGPVLLPPNNQLIGMVVGMLAFLPLQGSLGTGF